MQTDRRILPYNIALEFWQLFNNVTLFCFAILPRCFQISINLKPVTLLREQVGPTFLRKAIFMQIFWELWSLFKQTFEVVCQHPDRIFVTEKAGFWYYLIGKTGF